MPKQTHNPSYSSQENRAVANNLSAPGKQTAGLDNSAGGEILNETAVAANVPQAQLKIYQLMANASARRDQAAVYQAMADQYAGFTVRQMEKGKLPPPAPHPAVVQKKENHTGLPDDLKSGIENLSGYSLDDVRVHHNSDKPSQLQAHAYAQGTDIHVAPGQDKHLPHEAWHVVQQKQGRVQPTKQLKEDPALNEDARPGSPVQRVIDLDILSYKAGVGGEETKGFINLKKAVKLYNSEQTEVHLNGIVSLIDTLETDGVAGEAVTHLIGQIEEEQAAKGKLGNMGANWGAISLDDFLTKLKSHALLEKLLAKQNDATELKKIVDAAGSNYDALESIIPKMAVATLVKLLGRQNDAAELKKIVDVATANFEALETMIPKMAADVLARLLTKQTDAAELKKIVDVASSNYDALEPMIPKMTADTLARLLAKEKNAAELKKIVDVAGSNYDALETMIPKMSADVLAKLLAKQKDAAELKKIVDPATSNFDALETMIPKMAADVLARLLVKQQDAAELKKIVDTATSNFDALETMIPKMSTDVLAKLLAKEKDAAELKKLVDTATSNYDALETMIPKMTIGVLAKLLAKEKDAAELKKLVDIATSNFDALETMMPKVSVDVLAKLLAKEKDAAELKKLVDITTSNYDALETMIPKMSIDVLAKLLAKEKDAAELKKTVDVATSNFDALETMIPKMAADTLAKLLAKQKDAAELKKIVDIATSNYDALETMIPKMSADTLAKLLAKQKDAAELKKIVDVATSNYDGLETMIPVMTVDVLTKLLAKQKDAAELKKIVDIANANYDALETLIPKMTVDVLAKLLAKQKDAAELKKIVDIATANYDALETMIPKMTVDVLAKLLAKQKDAAELKKIVDVATANYDALETMVPKMTIDVLAKLLAKEKDAAELKKIVDVATSNFDALETMMPKMTIDVLAKLLAKEKDAAELKKIVDVVTSNYDALETMIPKMTVAVLVKLVTQQKDAAELKKIVDKATANYDALELLIEKLKTADPLVNLLTKESDAKKVKDKLEEIKAPLEDDGLTSDKAWAMFATLAEKDSLGATEIEALMAKMRGHLKKDSASSTEEKAYITDVKPQGTNIGQKLLTGKEIESHLRHTVDQGTRAGKDIEKLFPTGQDFTAMTNDALWYHCALDPANVTPGFAPAGTTGAKLMDLKTGATETGEQAQIRQKLALNLLKTKYPKPEAVQRMFFENEGQKPRAADQPDVEDARAVSTGSHIEDRHVINGVGNIRNDYDLAYRITRSQPANCPGKAGAFNSLANGKTELQAALDHLYTNGLWPTWREDILTSGVKQGQIACGTASSHIFTGGTVGAAALPRYIHQAGRGIRPMLPTDNWTTNMTNLANAQTMIKPNAQPGIATAPSPGDIVVVPPGLTFTFVVGGGGTVGPAGPSLTAAAAGTGVEVRIMSIDSAKGGFGFNSAWPY